MIIQSNPDERVLDEYDFIFINGNVLPITLDMNGGDSIVFSPTEVLITIKAKPSPTDPKGEIGDNTITICRQHLMFWEYRQRKQMSITPEQRIELQNTIKRLASDPRKLSPTIN